MRTYNSLKNICVAMIGQILSIIINFIARAIFIKILGSEYLGINGLFTNILSILSLAEMGIGTAIIYKLYKPLAEGDEYRTSALMNFYSKAYQRIGVLILILGILLLPILPYFIKDNQGISNISFIYILFLINTVVSYFFAYKRSIIIADQRNYITTIYKYAFYILLNIVQILLLILTKNYIYFIVTQIIITISENIMISLKADKMYPFLKENKNISLNVEDSRKIIKDVKALICHKIGGVIVGGTDNIIISSIVGIKWVGLYSNYNLIISALATIIGQIIGGVTSSIGNLNAIDSKEKSYEMYENILFFYFWLIGFCVICLWILFNPFINLWIGEHYVISRNLVLLIIINFYISQMRMPTLIYKETMGLFWQDRYKPLFESVINIIVSIVLAKRIGIAGVFIGTMISSITTAFWIEPYVLYKYGFKKNVYSYFIKFIKYTSIIIITCSFTDYISSMFNATTLITLICKMIICLIVPNIIFIICFYRTREFKYFRNLTKNILLLILNKVSKKKLNMESYK